MTVTMSWLEQRELEEVARSVKTTGLYEPEGPLAGA